VTEEVGRELQLEAVDALHAQGRGHHPGVVEQHVEGRVVGEEAVGEGRHRVEVGQVEVSHLERRRGVLGQDLLHGLGALGGVAHREHHLRPRAGQPAGGFFTRAAVGAGDDAELAGLGGYSVHGLSFGGLGVT
jgi:hypothetical protein